MEWYILEQPLPPVQSLSTFPLAFKLIALLTPIRNKGVHVYTTGQGSVSVLAINFKTGTVGDYLAYPCQDVGDAPYEYYIVSTGSACVFS